MAPACRALGVARATAYRRRLPRVASPARPRRRPPAALSDDERSAVLAELHSEASLPKQNVAGSNPVSRSTSSVLI
jgi:hypothetical protein